MVRYLYYSCLVFIFDKMYLCQESYLSCNINNEQLNDHQILSCTLVVCLYNFYFICNNSAILLILLMFDNRPGDRLYQMDGTSSCHDVSVLIVFNWSFLPKRQSPGMEWHSYIFIAAGL